MNKAQIIFVGASTTYGVGSVGGGWADLLKLELHQQMYSENTASERWHIYNLAVPAADLENQVERTLAFLKSIIRPSYQRITILQGGANNSLAINSPNNFVSTPERYREDLSNFISQLEKNSDIVIGVGLLPMDQTKVAPVNKAARTKVYFNNERLKLFEEAFALACAERDHRFIPLYDAALKAGWTEMYQYIDGIHPNQAGQQWILAQVKPTLMALLNA